MQLFIELFRNQKTGVLRTQVSSMFEAERGQLDDSKDEKYVCVDVSEILENEADMGIYAIKMEEIGPILDRINNIMLEDKFSNVIICLLQGIIAKYEELRVKMENGILQPTNQSANLD